MATRTRLSADGAPEYLPMAGPSFSLDHYQFARLHSALQAAGISPSPSIGEGWAEGDGYSEEIGELPALQVAGIFPLSLDGRGLG